MEYGADKGAKAVSTGEHPVRRGILRDIDEMEKLVDNLFNFELAAYAGAHTPVSSRWIEPPPKRYTTQFLVKLLIFDCYSLQDIRHSLRARRSRN